MGQSFGGQSAFGNTDAWRGGQSTAMGQGSGGPGRGSGLGPEEQAVDFTLRNEKATVNTGEGPVIASMLVQGSQIRGESTATFQQAVTAGRAEAAEAIEHSRVPRKYENAVRNYFGRLESAVEEDGRGDE